VLDPLYLSTVLQVLWVCRQELQQCDPLYRNTVLQVLCSTLPFCRACKPTARLPPPHPQLTHSHLTHVGAFTTPERAPKPQPTTTPPSPKTLHTSTPKTLLPLPISRIRFILGCLVSRVFCCRFPPGVQLPLTLLNPDRHPLQGLPQQQQDPAHR